MPWKVRSITTVTAEREEPDNFDLNFFLLLSLFVFVSYLTHFCIYLFFVVLGTEIRASLT
jgi:hypothetical protein